MSPKDTNGEIIDLSFYNPRQRTNVRMYGLDNVDWTPQDVAEYKRNWMAHVHPIIYYDFEDSHAFVLHKSKYALAQQWCKDNLYTHTWTAVLLASANQSAIHLEHEEDAILLKLAI